MTKEELELLHRRIDQRYQKAIAAADLLAEDARKALDLIQELNQEIVEDDYLDENGNMPMRKPKKESITDPAYWVKKNDETQDAGKEKIDDILKRYETNGNGQPPKRFETDENGRVRRNQKSTIRSRVVDALKFMPKQFTYHNVSGFLKDVEPGHVSTALSTLAADGGVQIVKRGGPGKGASIYQKPRKVGA